MAAAGFFVNNDAVRFAGIVRIKLFRFNPDVNQGMPLRAGGKLQIMQQAAVGGVHRLASQNFVQQLLRINRIVSVLAGKGLAYRASRTVIERMIRIGIFTGERSQFFQHNFFAAFFPALFGHLLSDRTGCRFMLFFAVPGTVFVIVRIVVIGNGMSFADIFKMAAGRFVEFFGTLNVFLAVTERFMRFLILYPFAGFNSAAELVIQPRTEPGRLQSVAGNRGGGVSRNRGYRSGRGGFPGRFPEFVAFLALFHKGFHGGASGIQSHRRFAQPRHAQSRSCCGNGGNGNVDAVFLHKAHKAEFFTPGFSLFAGFSVTFDQADCRIAGTNAGHHHGAVRLNMGQRHTQRRHRCRAQTVVAHNFG